MKVFDFAKLISKNQIRIDRDVFHCVCGKHSVWIPDLRIKLIWSHFGRVEAFRDWDKGRNVDFILRGLFNKEVKGWDRETLRSILSEYKLFKILAERKMSPPVGELIYIRKFVSDYPYGVELCDCVGRYGYEIQDANKIEPGKFTKEKFDEFLHKDKVIWLSSHAYNDVLKGDNVVNGYLIDMRRTIWDMFQDNFKLDLSYIEFPVLDTDVLEEKIKSLTQFPHKQRKQNYQTYFLNGEHKEGSRDILYRFSKMLVPEELEERSVLDLGCNLGSVLFECENRGAGKMVGIDFEKDYIECARNLAHYNQSKINFIRRDLTNTHGIIDYLRKYFCEGKIDYVFALSIYKHIEQAMFDILKSLNWEVCYVESHNAPEGLETDHVKEMVKGFKSLKCRSIYLGQTSDRSPRCLWRLERKKA